MNQIPRPETVILDYQEFKEWLDKNRNRRVGRSGSPCDCPVVNFAKQKLKKEVYFNGELAFLVNGVRIPLAEASSWAPKVAMLADMLQKNDIRGVDILKRLEIHNWISE